MANDIPSNGSESDDMRMRDASPPVMPAPPMQEKATPGHPLRLVHRFQRGMVGSMVHEIGLRDLLAQFLRLWYK